MSLSTNTGICDDLSGGEYEPEREHWYLRRSESRPQENAGICEDLRGTMRVQSVGVGHLKAFSLTARTPIAYAVWGTINKDNT
jgi:hypothetical protein